MATVGAVPAHGKFRQFRNSLSPRDWRRTKGMFAVILLLHVIGFGIFIAFVVPGHYKGLGIGISFTAYTLGLRHAFDADHISAIDNTTRKLMNERRERRGVEAPAQRRVLLLARALDDRRRDRSRPRHRRKGGLRRRLQQRLGPRAVRRDLRHRRLGVVPLPDRHA